MGLNRPKSTCAQVCVLSGDSRRESISWFIQIDDGIQLLAVGRAEVPISLLAVS